MYSPLLSPFYRRRVITSTPTSNLRIAASSTTSLNESPPRPSSPRRPSRPITKNNLLVSSPPLKKNMRAPPTKKNKNQKSPRKTTHSPKRKNKNQKSPRKTKQTKNNTPKLLNAIKTKKTMI